MGSPHEVLVVDEPTVADEIADALSRADGRFDIVTSTTADAARDCLDDREYDAIVSEVALPESDGLDLLESVRKDRESTIPVVIFTSENDERVPIEALNLGADRYVQKGDDVQANGEELATVVRSEIDRYRERTQQQLSRDIVEQLDDPVMYQDLDGTFERINRAVADYADLPKSELLGSDEHAFMDEAAADTIASNKAQVLREETALSYEIRPSFPAVGERWFSTLRYPHYDENGRVDGTVAICRDVSELKRTQQELKAERDRLEEFASFVSHDLRNPLSAASARLELLGEDCDSPHLENIEANLEHMDDLITDLLSLAQQGDIIGDSEPVQLGELARECWDNVETSGVELVLGDVPVVRADPDRLVTLLENLFRNADQHGGDDVTVTVGGMADGFYVADDGPGIPPDERDAVFESGYSTEQRGTGFGLAIVRQVVEAHGWQIEIADSEDGGARFEVTGVETVES